MKKNIIAIFMTLLSLTLITGCGQQSANTTGTPVLHVGTDAAYAPFTYQDENDNYVGFDMDLINAVAEDAGMKIEISNMNFDGIIPALQNGNIDVAVAGMSITPERQQIVDFTNPYYTTGMSIAIRKETKDINSMSDLEGKIIGVTIGTTEANEAHKIPNATVREFNTLPDTFTELKNKGVDAILNELPTNQYYITSTNSDFATIAAPLSHPESLAIVIRKGNVDLQAKLNKSLQNIKDNGKYDEIYKKWFGNNNTSK